MRHSKGPGSRLIASRLAILLLPALGILASCIILEFWLPLAPQQLTAPSATLIERLPLWSIVASHVAGPQSPTAAIVGGIGAVLLFAAFYFLALSIGRRLRAGRLPLAIVLGGMCLFCLASVFSLPNTGSDIYLYMMYAREFIVYRANPFTAWPASFAGDPYLAYAPSIWVYTPSLYGPIWTALSVVSGLWSRGDVVRDLLSLRLMLFAFNLGSALLIWKILGRLNPSYRVAGLILFAWNPIVILQGQQHVEPVIVFLLLASVVLYQSRRRAASVVAVGLSAVTKLVTAPLFVIDLFFISRGRRPKYAWIGLLLAAGLVLFLLPNNLFTLRRLLFLPLFAGAILWAISYVWSGAGPDGETGRTGDADELPRLLLAWSVVLAAFNLLLGSMQFSWYLIPLVGVVALVSRAPVVAFSLALTFSSLLYNALVDIVGPYYDLPVNLFRVIWWVPACALLAWTFRSAIARAISAARRSWGAKAAWAVPSTSEKRDKRAVWALRGLVALGLAALVYYLSWWFGGSGARIASPWLVLALMLAALYNWVQLVGNWLLYLAARRRPAPPPVPDSLTVDVYVTCCREDHTLIERALSAACAMRGPHNTYLLDDGDEPALEAMASRLGAAYLTRVGREHAKAGNLNAALSRTSGDIVVIFDIDHAPEPDFLERSLGYFADPRVGFVQVMLTFCNGAESWVARAAGESALDYYNPTSVGMDGIGSATLVGSNALIRRTALEGIGGYQPGLAEDLATSIALHGAGWQSVYLAEPLAPGLAPPNVAAWFTQQLKWARGVFDLLLFAYPRYFSRLTWGQRLSYAVRMTYYWIGPLVSIHLLFILALLFGGSGVAQIGWDQYIVHIVPLAAITMLIRQAALLAWRHPSTPSSLLWRAMCLVYATWPVYMLAWVMAVLQVRLAFRATPKKSNGGVTLVWLLPQAAALVLLVTGVLYTLTARAHDLTMMPVLFALVQSIPLAIFLWYALRERRRVDAAARQPIQLPALGGVRDRASANMEVVMTTQVPKTPGIG
jgi:cellulose synthase/poly-beta-1,6-N-acetylglucosamine synthase-like glycosyltransferase